MSGAHSRSPSLAGLTWLDVRGADLTPVGVNALLDSPHLKNLTGLHVYFRRSPTLATEQATFERVRARFPHCVL